MTNRRFLITLAAAVALCGGGAPAVLAATHPAAHPAHGSVSATDDPHGAFDGGNGASSHVLAATAIEYGLIAALITPS